MNDYRDYYLSHHGILGQKWGIRRFQSYDTVPRKSGKRGKELKEAKKRAKHYQKTLNALDKRASYAAAKNAGLAKELYGYVDRYKRAVKKGKSAVKTDKIKQNFNSVIKRQYQTKKDYIDARNKINKVLKEMRNDSYGIIYKTSNTVRPSYLNKYKQELDKTAGKGNGINTIYNENYYQYVRGTKYKVRPTSEKRKKRYAGRQTQYGYTPIRVTYI